MSDASHVSIPRSVVERALAKARLEYERALRRNGQAPFRPGEVWAEFEMLATYLGVRSNDGDEDSTTASTPGA